MNKPKRTPLLAQARHASTLKPGMQVLVRSDDGTDVTSEVLDEPWLIGGHTYVVNCKGFRAFDVMRVRLNKWQD